MLVVHKPLTVNLGHDTEEVNFTICVAQQSNNKYKLIPSEVTYKPETLSCHMVPGSSINWFPADAIRERSWEKDPHSVTIVVRYVATNKINWLN